MEVEEALSHGRRSRRRAGGAAGVDLSAFSSSGGDTVGFGGGFGDYVDDDDDPMLAAALAISRGEAPPGMGADGEFNPSLSGGLLGNDASLAALSAAQAHAMSGLVEGAPGRLGRRRSFTGAWKGKLQCLSSEAMDHAALSDGDKVRRCMRQLPLISVCMMACMPIWWKQFRHTRCVRALQSCTHLVGGRPPTSFYPSPHELGLAPTVHVARDYRACWRIRDAPPHAL